MYSGNLCNKAIEFINSFENEIAIDASFRKVSSVGSTIQALLDSRKVKYILRLRLPNSWDVMAQRFWVVIELYNCGMSLEEFLLNEDFRTFRDRVLGVSSVIDV